MRLVEDKYQQRRTTNNKGPEEQYNPPANEPNTSVPEGEGQSIPNVPVQEIQRDTAPENDILQEPPTSEDSTSDESPPELSTSSDDEENKERKPSVTTPSPRRSGRRRKTNSKYQGDKWINHIFEEPPTYDLPYHEAFLVESDLNTKHNDLTTQFDLLHSFKKDDNDEDIIHSPVVGWSTIRLLLIMSIILNLDTKQVDYTLAFVHAEAEPGTYIEMPRMFEREGYILELKRNLYGQRDAPLKKCNYLKAGLERIHASKE